MRLPDPYTHPGAAPGFQTAKLVDNDPVVRDQLPNGKVKEVKMSAQYWSIDITYPELYEAEYRLFSAFIKNCKRKGEFIEVLLPNYESFRVRGDANLVSVQSGLKGSTVILTNTNVLSGAPRVGDIFKLSNHPKVYEIVEFVNAGNRWELGVYPDLFITTNGSEKPVFNGIQFQTKILNADAFGQELNADGVYQGLSLSLREAL
ncbi:tape measure chaperone [Serratia phage Slocum]|nr:tape measure chaperone [Serratia phage Slocum]URC22539.1 distal tail protein [Serratia phage vB_SmaM-Kamaji]